MSEANAAKKAAKKAEAKAKKAAMKAAAKDGGGAPPAAASKAPEAKKQAAALPPSRPMPTKSRLRPNQISFNPNVSLEDRPVVALTVAILAGPSRWRS